MPLHMPPTMAEREAELAALQSAFDEYIASSRELEEELDAELAKMQEKLAESSGANAALSLQLENIAPQLTSFENSLGDCRKQLREQQNARRQAEQAQDVAEAKMRELQDEVNATKTENDAVTEELAFKDAELEEAVMKMEIEKEQLREELEDLRADLIAHVQREKASASGKLLPKEREGRIEITDENAFDRDMDAVDDAYAKKLEDELELVTEQLIDTQKRYNVAQDQLSQCHGTIQALENQRQNEEKPADDAMIRHLQKENADRLEDEQLLRRELEQAQQELELTREELQAAEDDSKNYGERLDNIRAQHRDEVSNLQQKVSKYGMERNSNQSEFALIEKALQETLATSAAESLAMKEEIDNLNKALKNTKTDYNTLLEEFETVSSRFDEACHEAEQKGRESVLDNFKKEQGKELGQLKDQFLKLEQENAALQEKLDQAELTLSSVQQTQDKNMDQAQTNNEILQKLQSQLVHAKEDLVKKDKELGKIVKDLEARLDKAEETVHQTETELSQTKAKLAEADARLIVLTREKKRIEGTFPTHNGQSDADSSDDYSESRDDVSRLSSWNDQSNYRRLGRDLHRRRRSRSSSPPSVTRLEYRLSEESKKFKDLNRQHQEIKDQKRMGEVRIKRLEEDLRVLQTELLSQNADNAVVTKVMNMSSLASTEHGMDVLKAEDTMGNRINDIIESRDHRTMADELRALDEKCSQQREYNAQLLSKMLNLQGNIQVFCRIRPMRVSEVQRGYKGVVEALSETEIGCFDSRSNKWKSFAFDRVWGPDQSQQSIFQDVEPVALSVVDGFNACIFAYGQTGSGKTFTMEGSETNNQFGISYRTIQKIFHLLNLRAQQQKAADLIVGDDSPESVSFTFSLEISMLEIYNDGVYDLLGSSSEEKKRQSALDVRRDAEGRVEVPGLSREAVFSIEDVMSVLKRGNKNRAVAATDLNEHSSRSHMVLIVNVATGSNGVANNRGTLYLVDLAGSERVRKSNVEGAALKEAGHINKSLSALGNVMEALDRKASHVPYRDSKLTYLLQDSLGGNSRTMMIVACCPMDVACDETVHALQFATRVRRIQIGTASRNNVSSKNLEETVKALTDQLKSTTRAKEQMEGQLQSLKRDNNRIQDRLQNLSTSRSQTRSDSRTLEVLRKNNTEMATRWQKEKRLREEASDELEKTMNQIRKLQQQISKKSRDFEQVQKDLKEKERSLELASRDLRQAKEAQSAAALRARRAQVLSARNRKTTPSGTSSRQTTSTRPSVVVHPVPSTDPLENSTNTGTSASTNNAVTSMVTSMEGDKTGTESSTLDPLTGIPSTGAVVSARNGEEKQVSELVDSNTSIDEIRERVLSLLDKYDKGKVNRIDIIMEKFKGKEHLLLQKMIQRYEGGQTSVDVATSAQKRNEMAMERHKERMRALRESRGG